MTKQLFSCCVFFLSLTLCSTPVWAQHDGDVDFEYEGGKLVFEDGPVFEGEFPTSGLFARFTSDPGFETHEPIGPGDIISYNVLDNLYYWSGVTQDFASPGATTITIDNAVGADTIVGAGTGIMIPGGIIGQASGSGDFHAHINFVLSEFADFGAYGLLLQLSTDDPLIDDSDPFFFVFNYGLNETLFDTAAIPAFEAVLAVPEPSSFVLSALGVGALGLAAWRRRRTKA